MINMKFGTTGPLPLAKFHIYRSSVSRPISERLSKCTSGSVRTPVIKSVYCVLKQMNVAAYIWAHKSPNSAAENAADATESRASSYTIVWRYMWTC